MYEADERNIEDYAIIYMGVWDTIANPIVSIEMIWNRYIRQKSGT